MYKLNSTRTHNSIKIAKQKILLKEFKLINTNNLNFFLFLFLAFYSNLGFSQLAIENFETGIPSTWTAFNNSFGSGLWSSTTDGYLGSNAAVINPAGENIGQGNTAQYFLVTPQFQTPANGEIRFYTKQGSTSNNGTIYQLRISTASQPDIAGFGTVLQTWTEAQLNSNATMYEEKIVALPPSIPAGLNIYIAFVAVNNQTGTLASGDSWYVDNVRVIPACSKVTSISTNITPTEALLSWTNSAASNFQIQVVPFSTPINTTGTTVSGFSYNATGLMPETYYDVYIKTICDSETASIWAGPFTFVTTAAGFSCDAPIIIPSDVSTMPYVLSTNLQNFHNTTSYTSYTSQGMSCIPASLPTTYNYLAGDHAYLSYTPTTSGLINISIATNVLAGGGGIGCFNQFSDVFIFDNCAGIGTTAQCLAFTNTTPSVPSNQISNFYVQAGVTYTIVISTNLIQNAGICFTFTLSGSSCPSPSGISYSNLLQTSANFSWNNVANLVNAWEYVALPTSYGAPNGSETVIPTATNSNNLVTGLTANTNYNLYVRSVCAGTPGPWGNPFPFRTQCPVYPTPYFTNFNGASASSPEPCWTSLDLNHDFVTWTYGQLGVQGQRATMPTSNTGNFNYDILSTPQVELSGSQKRLRFKYQTYGLGLQSTFAIKLSTTGVGENNFTTTLVSSTLYSTLGTDAGWTEMIIPIPATITGPVNIAWILYNGDLQTANRLNIDDVYIEDMPACSAPTFPSVTASSITTTSAQLNWNNGLPLDNQWDVSVLPFGSGAPTGNGQLVSSNPYVINGLIPSTKYEFYVRTHCSATQQSVWVGPIVFNTLCIGQNVPYYESYNDTDLTSKKFCWSVNNANNDSAFWVLEATQARIAPLGNGFSNPFVSYNDYLISAPINVMGQKKIRFNYRSAIQLPNFATSRGALQILISTTDTNPNSFSVLVPTFEYTNSAFQEFSTLFTANGTVYIALRVPPDMLNPTNSGLQIIDDFRIEDAPSCSGPITLNASNVTTTTASLSWSAGDTETQWEIAVQNQGVGMPSGTGIMVNTTSSYLATGLTPGTAYEFYVKAICSTTLNSQWVGPFTFSTSCVAFTTPFLETFDSNSQSESCWRVKNLNNDGDFWNLNQTVQPIFGDQMAALFSGNNGNNNDWLISPTITVQPNQRLRFYYKVKDSFFQEDLKVLLSTTGSNVSQFTTTLFDTGTSFINNEQYEEMVINLTGITAPTDVNLAFVVPFFPPNPSNYRGQFLFIDNIIIEDIPLCPTISNVTIQNVIDTSAEINWTVNGSETNWEISLQPFGTPAPIGATLPQYLITTTSHPYTFTGLIPATQYQYYIRSLCNTSSQSEWVGPFEFTTRCDFTNVCQYTISLSNGNSGQVTQALDILQNGVVVQSLTFPNSSVQTPVDNVVFLCTGVQYDLYWRGITGSNGTQYSAAQVVVKDQSNTIVWTSPLGIGTSHTTIYSGFANCGTVTCQNPTNQTVSNQGVFSWTAGGSEVQWEVFVQPLGNGTLPQSGTIVNTNSYTPVASDFVNATSATYEYFVRAICGSGNTSYWSGPFVFIRNDEPTTSVPLQINSGTLCQIVSTDASFIRATPSTIPSTCGGINGGDIWYDFTATAKVHSIELSDFSPGSYWTSSFQGPWPKITMTLYEVQTDGSLIEKGCSDNNSFVTMYSSELIVGTNYKIRLTLNDTVSNDKKFHICISTPEPCDMNAFNYDFEKLPMQNVTGIATIITHLVVPGWRVNTNVGSIFFNEASNSITVYPYSGGQCIQLTSDSPSTWDPNNPNIKGLYKDFDTSEIIQMDYSFASASRNNSGSTIQLYAGPPSGPFILVTEDFANGLNWELIEGQYMVPTGQNTTRFIFRVKEYAFGHVLDAANFVPNTDIITSDTTITCSTLASILLEAQGVGQWVADANNPAASIIETPNVKSTNVTGFTAPGNYIFHWITRYCDKTITINYLGINEIPVVTSPVIYCLNATTTPLSATVSSGYSLVWYTVPVGGTGSIIAPTPSSSIVGNSQIYYVSALDGNGCEGARTEIIVQVNDLPTATISGSGTQCSGNNATIFFNGTPNAIVTYSIDGGSNLNITLDPSGNASLTTAVLTTSTTYNLVSIATSETLACSQSQTGSAIITVIPLPTATISGTTTICSGNTTTITFNGTPEAIVTFTIDGGTSQTITLDATGNASITTPILTTSSTYTLVSIASNETSPCVQTLTGSVLISITIATPQNLLFSYNDTCINAVTNPLPVLTTNFTTGGTFSSSTVTVNASTGEITLSTASVGLHDITYTTIADVPNCIVAQSYTTSINITNGNNPVTTFDYESNYCFNSTNVLPTKASGFSANGTFSSTSGLIIDSVTGEINISQSNPGIYIITYLVNADVSNCITQSASTDTITISSTIETKVEDMCQNGILVLQAMPINNSYNANTANYTWYDFNNNSVGTEILFNVDQYSTNNPAVVFPLTFTVNVEIDGCIGSATFIVSDNPCKLIPRGISPNNDGNNDTFDLTGLGVKELLIFNRYGLKVYSFNGNYTNQWNGLTNKGKELPDGTYFYNVVKENGITVTGWVYINRQY